MRSATARRPRKFKEEKMADFEVACWECGKPVEQQWKQGGSYGPILRVKPCQICQDEAVEQGREEGRKEAE